jgi:triphosphatase
MTKKVKARKMLRAAGLATETNGLDAFRRLLREGAAIHDAHRAEIPASDDPEHVHQARVVLRRMRSLLRGFSAMVSGKTAEELDQLLQARAHLLAPVRDADVHALALAGSDQAEDAAAEAARRRAELRQKMAEGRTLSLKIEIEALLREPARAFRGKRRQRLAAAPVGIIASRALHVTWTELLAFGPDLRVLSPDELHSFRKRGKDMRYLTEFFAPIFDQDARPMLKKISRLQDALGLLNDLHNMQAQQDEPGALPLPDDVEDREHVALKSAVKAWKKLRKAAPWWCQP